jgi:homoserine O-acetyltransferase
MNVRGKDFMFKLPTVRACALLLTALTLHPPAHAIPNAAMAEPIEGDYVAENFRFASGETLPELRVHFSLLGKPHRNAQGHVDNAVLILHDTGGSGHSFLTEKFAGVLFGKGQPLDVSRYFVILPDGIGHGKSSRPSDGLHAHFPRYTYQDMVQAQFLTVTDGLQVNHLRLIIGASMGCMHTWLWGEAHPEFVDALMPLACLSTPVAGRERVWNDLIADAIRSDPEWQQGEYRVEPTAALRTAAGLLLVGGSAPIQMQSALSQPEAADDFVRKYMERELPDLDANDLLYQVDASRGYDGSTALDKIRVPVLWVNAADDFVNPPELGVAEREVTRLKNARFLLLPASARTHGHGTPVWAAAWQEYLVQLLAALPPA